MAKERIISSERLRKKLTGGEYKEVIDYASKLGNELDVQIRDNYLNIYYRGGNLLKINPQSLYFDEFYFHRGAKDMRKTHLKKQAHEGDKKCIALWESYKEKREEMLNILKNDGMANYCPKMKSIMDEWEDDLRSIGIKHDEKNDQQQISMNNRGATDYTVIDLEYAVSITSPFCYNGESKKNVPRFDIVAIDRSGQLYVIELKTGLGAIDGDSGIRAHIDCFEHTIGRDPKGAFVNEMAELLKQKQELNLIDRSLKIDSSKKPQFIFAFSEKQGEHRYEEFVNACKVCGYNGKVIYVSKDYKLRDK